MVGTPIPMRPLYTIMPARATVGRLQRAVLTDECIAYKLLKRLMKPDFESYF